MTETRKKALEMAKTARITKGIKITGVGKNGKENKNDENLRYNLARVLCIWYHINFRKKSVLLLFDLGSEINVIYLIFAKELGFSIRPTDIEKYKIDGTMLDSYEIVVIAFLIMNKANQIRFFKKTFQEINVSLEVVFWIPFLMLNSANIDFLDWELR